MASGILRITLLYESGPHFQARRLVVCVRLEAIFGSLCPFTEAGPACLSVIESQGADNKTIAPDRLGKLRQLIMDIGMLERELDLRPTIDTSDFSTAFELHVEYQPSLEQASTYRRIRLEMASSGFEGEDAAALKRVLNEILTVVEVRDKRVWSSLTDRS